jgi:hypothetical protein
MKHKNIDSKILNLERYINNQTNKLASDVYDDLYNLSGGAPGGVMQGPIESDEGNEADNRQRAQDEEEKIAREEIPCEASAVGVLRLNESGWDTACINDGQITKAKKKWIIHYKMQLGEKVHSSAEMSSIYADIIQATYHTLSNITAKITGIPSFEVDSLPPDFFKMISDLLLMLKKEEPLSTQPWKELVIFYDHLKPELQVLLLPLRQFIDRDTARHALNDVEKALEYTPPNESGIIRQKRLNALEKMKLLQQQLTAQNAIDTTSKAVEFEPPARIHASDKIREARIKALGQLAERHRDFISDEIALNAIETARKALESVPKHEPQSTIHASVKIREARIKAARALEQMKLLKKQFTAQNSIDTARKALEFVPKHETVKTRAARIKALDLYKNLANSSVEEAKRLIEAEQRGGPSPQQPKSYTISGKEAWINYYKENLRHKSSTELTHIKRAVLETLNNIDSVWVVNELKKEFFVTIYKLLDFNESVIKDSESDSNDPHESILNELCIFLDIDTSYILNKVLRPLRLYYLFTKATAIAARGTDEDGCNIQVCNWNPDTNKCKGQQLIKEFLFIEIHIDNYLQEMLSPHPDQPLSATSLFFNEAPACTAGRSLQGCWDDFKERGAQGAAFEKLKSSDEIIASLKNYFYIKYFTNKLGDYLNGYIYLGRNWDTIGPELAPGTRAAEGTDQAILSIFIENLNKLRDFIRDDFNQIPETQIHRERLDYFIYMLVEMQKIITNQLSKMRGKAGEMPQVRTAMAKGSESGTDGWTTVVLSLPCMQHNQSMIDDVPHELEKYKGIEYVFLAKLGCLGDFTDAIATVAADYEETKEILINFIFTALKSNLYIRGSHDKLMLQMKKFTSLQKRYPETLSGGNPTGNQTRPMGSGSHVMSVGPVDSAAAVVRQVREASRANRLTFPAMGSPSAAKINLPPPPDPVKIEADIKAARERTHQLDAARRAAFEKRFGPPVQTPPPVTPVAPVSPVSPAPPPQPPAQYIQSAQSTQSTQSTQSIQSAQSSPTSGSIGVKSYEEMDICKALTGEHAEEEAAAAQDQRSHGLLDKRLSNKFRIWKCGLLFVSEMDKLAAMFGNMHVEEQTDAAAAELVIDNDVSAKANNEIDAHQNHLMQQQVTSEEEEEAAAEAKADRLAVEAAAKAEEDRLAVEAAAKAEEDRLAVEAAAKAEGAAAAALQAEKQIANSIKVNFGDVITAANDLDSGIQRENESKEAEQTKPPPPSWAGLAWGKVASLTSNMLSIICWKAKIDELRTALLSHTEDLKKITLIKNHLNYIVKIIGMIWNTAEAIGSLLFTAVKNFISIIVDMVTAVAGGLISGLKVIGKALYKFISDIAPHAIESTTGGTVAGVNWLAIQLLWLTNAVWSVICQFVMGGVTGMGMVSDITQRGLTLTIETASAGLNSVVTRTGAVINPMLGVVKIIGNVGLELGEQGLGKLCDIAIIFIKGAYSVIGGTARFGKFIIQGVVGIIGALLKQLIVVSMEGITGLINTGIYICKHIAAIIMVSISRNLQDDLNKLDADYRAEKISEDDYIEMRQTLEDLWQEEQDNAAAGVYGAPLAGEEEEDNPMDNINLYTSKWLKSIGAMNDIGKIKDFLTLKHGWAQTALKGKVRKCIMIFINILEEVIMFVGQFALQAGVTVAHGIGEIIAKIAGAILKMCWSGTKIFRAFPGIIYTMILRGSMAVCTLLSNTVLNGANIVKNLGLILIYLIQIIIRTIIGGITNVAGKAQDSLDDFEASGQREAARELVEQEGERIKEIFMQLGKSIIQFGPIITSFVIEAIFTGVGAARAVSYLGLDLFLELSRTLTASLTMLTSYPSKRIDMDIDFDDDDEETLYPTIKNCPYDYPYECPKESDFRKHPGGNPSKGNRYSCVDDEEICDISYGDHVLNRTKEMMSHKKYSRQCSDTGSGDECE